jgi:galactitol-specific phosphotransferase system IIB component
MLEVCGAGVGISLAIEALISRRPFKTSVRSFPLTR